jgi:hypothetical protein
METDDVGGTDDDSDMDTADAFALGAAATELAPGPETSQTELHALHRIRAVLPRSFSSSAV